MTMHRTNQQAARTVSRAPVGATGLHRTVNLNAFKPSLPVARLKLNELIARGATVVSVQEGLVQLVRMGQRAQVDAVGRVQWNAR